MIFTETPIRGAFIIDLERHEDERGYFARTFSQDEFRAHGLEWNCREESIGFNRRRGTVRGMHFQYPPFAESKLVRCTRGALLDVIVDLRPESATYLDHVAVELSVATARALYSPQRFAHGYQTLADDTEAAYLMAQPYVAGSEGGLPHDDPRLGIAWPLPVTSISDRDRDLQPYSALGESLRQRMTVERQAG